MTGSTVTVVICAYTLDRWELLLRSIRSIRAQAPPPSQLLVVVDHNDELTARLRAAEPTLSVVASANRRGLSGARNAGLAAATGDVVAFIDDDAAAEPGWLAELIRGYDDPRVAGVGGAIEAEWEAGRPRWIPPEFDWVVGCSYRGQARTIAQVRNPIGANMSFRRASVDAVGGFRDGLGRIGTTPVGGEETELCIRIVQHEPAARFQLRPAARVRHAVPGSRVTVRYFLRRCYAEGLSKAVITRTVGRSAGLASERTYTTRTLPAGVLRGLRDALRGDLAGVARAAAIVIGLVTTTAGYVIGSVRAPGTASEGVAGGPHAGLRAGAVDNGQPAATAGSERS